MSFTKTKTFWVVAALALYRTALPLGGLEAALGFMAGCVFMALMTITFIPQGSTPATRSTTPEQDAEAHARRTQLDEKGDPRR